MLLAVDIGNSGIKFGVFDGKDCVMPLCSFSVSSLFLRSVDEYRLLIHQLLSERGFDSMIDSSVIVSVAPTVTPVIYDAVSEISGAEPFTVGSGTRTGFGIKIDDPAQLGTDIVANTAASLLFCKPPVIIADLGTATTLTTVNSSSEITGTIIIPGVKTASDALTAGAEQLSDITLTKPRNLIGKNSSDSMRSGIINGNILMIDAFIRNLRQELCTEDEKLSLTATGGFAEKIIPYCRNKFTVYKDLTLIGAAALYYKNRKQL